MSTTSTTNCNLNCICMNSDCLYKHFIPYKERKIVKKFYDDISDKVIEEPNMDSRKKNCTFGQLCEKENCGYKHRLSFANRQKLYISYKYNKICPNNSQTTNVSVMKREEPEMTIHNSFMILTENEFELQDDVQVPVVAETNGKSWVSIVKNEIVISDNITSKSDNYVPINWEDCADDDFYMTF